MKLYHAAPIPLGAGSVIEPGNFGRCIQLHPIGSHVAHRELAYEHVRQNSFPQKPSRLNSIFLLLSKNEAIEYRSLNTPSSLIYEVEVLNTAAKHHATYIDLVCGMQNPPEPVSHLYRHAQSYWQESLEPFGVESTESSAMAEASVSMGAGLQTRLRELVIESPIRIVRRLQD